jgi:hypothetical protein
VTETGHGSAVVNDTGHAIDGETTHGFDPCVADTSHVLPDCVTGHVPAVKVTCCVPCEKVTAGVPRIVTAGLDIVTGRNVMVVGHWEDSVAGHKPVTVVRAGGVVVNWPVTVIAFAYVQLVTVTFGFEERLPATRLTRIA